MSQNITVALDAETIRRAKVVAAKRGTSVSGLLREEIRRLVEADQRYDSARVAATARLRRGSHLGGGPLPDRNALYDRASLR